MKPEEELLNVATWTEKYPHCHQIWLGDFLGLLVVNHPEYAKGVYNRSGKESVLFTCDQSVMDVYMWGGN